MPLSLITMWAQPPALNAVLRIRPSAPRGLWLSLFEGEWMRQAVFISGPPGAGKTTVAALLGLRLSCPVVEVDDVKVQRHGTTAKSTPENFSEAGRRARDALAEHDRVIIVEAFGEDSWVRLVRHELPSDASISHVYLWCDAATAVSRKAEQLPEAVVLGQLKWFPKGPYSGRFSIDTTSREAIEISDEIVAWLKA